MKPSEAVHFDVAKNKEIDTARHHLVIGLSPGRRKADGGELLFKLFSVSHATKPRTRANES